jgi:serine/threonine protein kinase
MINSIIGKYKVIRLLGEGGTASVYEAEHEMLGTKAAIKVLNPILSSSIQIKERFRNEAKLMASLNHPNITKVIDFDENENQLSIIMEFLEGEDLNRKIKREGPLSDNETLTIFTQTLGAFAYAHDKGIVHRDIKPSNIFVLPNGQIKILDFGIAKLLGQGNEMTLTGMQMGTPVYMSPEQVKTEKEIDQRSDIYSLGVTLFFMVNGKPPYNSATESAFDIYSKIVHEPLPQIQVKSTFQDFIHKSCRKLREERFQSCNECLRFLNSNVEDSEDITVLEPMHLDENKSYASESGKGGSTNIHLKQKVGAEKQIRKVKKPFIFVGLFVLFVSLIGLYFFLGASSTFHEEGIFKDWNYSDSKVFGLVPLNDTRNRDYYKISKIDKDRVKVEEFNERGIVQITHIIQFSNNKLASISSIDKRGFTYNTQSFKNSKAGLEETCRNYGENSVLPSKSLVHKFQEGLLTETSYKGFDGKIGSGPNGYAVIKYSSYTDENRFGLWKEKAFFDSEGNPFEYGEYHKVKLKRDDRGNIINETYWDGNGKPVTNEYGVHQITYKYNQSDNLIEENYYSLLGKPVLNTYGICKIKYEYSDGLHIRTVRYSSANMVSQEAGLQIIDGASIIEYEYDKRANIISQVYFNHKKEQINSTYGYAKIIQKFDGKDNCIQQSFFNQSNEAVEDIDQVHRYVYTYDQFGFNTSTAYFDRFNQPRNTNLTYMQKFKYNELGQRISVSYWKNENEKITRWSGEHEEQTKYNEQGQKIETYYLDKEGQLYKAATGESRVVSQYDRYARLASVATFDGNQPSIVVGASVVNYHLIRYLYDGQNRRSEIQYFDVNGKPCNASVDQYGLVSKIEMVYQGNKIVKQKWYKKNEQIPFKTFDCYESECMHPAGMSIRWINK